jgi:hypothetical protein
VGQIVSFAESVSLNGQQVSLVPLSHAHHDNLIDALKDGELWTLWYTSIPCAGSIAGRNRQTPGVAEAGSMLPFAVIQKATNEAVGMTTFMNIDAI